MLQNQQVKSYRKGGDRGGGGAAATCRACLLHTATLVNFGQYLPEMDLYFSQDGNGKPVKLIIQHLNTKPIPIILA